MNDILRAQERLSCTIPDAQKLTGLGRTSIYEAIASGKLDARKAGKRTLITAKSLKIFLANLPRADIGKTSTVRK